MDRCKELAGTTFARGACGSNRIAERVFPTCAVARRNVFDGRDFRGRNQRAHQAARAVSKDRCWDTLALAQVVTSPKSNGLMHGFEVALQLQVRRLKSRSRAHVLGQILGCQLPAAARPGGIARIRAELLRKKGL